MCQRVIVLTASLALFVSPLLACGDDGGDTSGSEPQQMEGADAGTAGDTGAEADAPAPSDAEADTDNTAPDAEPDAGGEVDNSLRPGRVEFPPSGSISEPSGRGSFGPAMRWMPRQASSRSRSGRTRRSWRCCPTLLRLPTPLSYELYNTCIKHKAGTRCHSLSERCCHARTLLDGVN